MSKELTQKHNNQKPRINYAPLFTTTLADDAVDLAAEVGLILDPWQKYVLRQTMGINKDNKWACSDVGLVVPRQNGKNIILEARELAGVFLLGEKEIKHTAHTFKTALDAHSKLMERLRSSAELMEYVTGFEGDTQAEHIRGFKTSHGFEAILFTNGARIEYATRTPDGGRGLKGELLIIDEAFALTDRQLAGLYSIQAARSLNGRTQTWFTSSSGDTSSLPLLRLRKRALDKTNTPLGYFEWSCEEDADHMDKNNWYTANPALGIRISEEFVQRELETLKEEEFKRERLGIWGFENNISSLINKKQWVKLATNEKSERVGRTIFSIDIPPTRDVTTICASSYTTEGKIIGEIVARDYGTAWVAPKIKQLLMRNKGSMLILSNSSAVSCLEYDFREQKVRPRYISKGEFLQASSVFYDLVQQEKILHTDQEILNSAILNGKARYMSNGLWYWRKCDPLVDISPLVALSVAVWGVTRFSTETNKTANNNNKLYILER